MFNHFTSLVQLSINNPCDGNDYFLYSKFIKYVELLFLQQRYQHFVNYVLFVYDKYFIQKYYSHSDFTIRRFCGGK